MSIKLSAITSLLVSSIIIIFTEAALAQSSTTAAILTSKTAAPPLDSNRKQQLIHMVKQDCGSCHGMTLKGGLGPALLPEDLKEKPILLLKNTILFGRPGTAMPPWQTLLTEQEALWISQQLQQGLTNEK